MISTGIFYVAMTILGLVFGSFAGATVWRLRASQLVADKKTGEPVDETELRRLRPLTKASIAQDRSRCLHCKHELAWYDLLPLASWLSTKGKCRYCKEAIGWFEPAIELGSAFLFAAFSLFWVQTYGLALWPLLLIWVVILVLFVILFAYDAMWFLLPDAAMWPLIALSLVVAGYGISAAPNPTDAVASVAGAVLILAGLYLALWLVSSGKWVGFGDVKLGFALGLLLGSWQLAFLGLFTANLLGTLIVLPGLATGRLSRKAHIPFGPLLIAGFFIALFVGSQLITSLNTLTNNMLMLY